MPEMAVTKYTLHFLTRKSYGEGATYSVPYFSCTTLAFPFA